MKLFLFALESGIEDEQNTFSSLTTFFGHQLIN